MIDNILKIEHQKLKQIAGAPEGLAVPAPLVEINFIVISYWGLFFRYRS